MELDKKKYKRDEVENLLSACKIQYESKLKERDDREAELVEENKKLLAELGVYKDKDALLSSALIDAQKQANALVEASYQKYELEIEKLKDFAKRWKIYFQYISEKYPHYEATNDARAVYDKLCEVLTNKKSASTLNAVDKVFEEKSRAIVSKQFNPKEKIAEYISATSDNGFNLDDVLNPGDLKLEDLCKELGLIDEN